jgi:hypothetical protein
MRGLKHSDSWVNSVACPSAGNCAVTGGYDAQSGQQGFVATENNGVWGTAIEVPGLGTLNKGGTAAVNAVSCGSADACAAVGAYTDAAGKRQGFVASENHGVWGKAVQLPGLAALNTGGNTQIQTVSCAAAGSCAAGGFYADSARHHRGFVASENNGVWGKAVGVPGLGALNAGKSAAVSSISCPAAGHCAAGGFYTDRSRKHQGFVTRAR